MASEVGSRSSSRWRTALRFLVRSLDLRASSFALALVAVTVGASVTATAFNLEADLERKMTRDLREYGANLMLTPPLARDPGGVAATLDQRWVETIGALAPAGHRAWVSPFLLASGRTGDLPVNLLGLDFVAAQELAAAWRLDGAWPPPDDAASCVVGASLAARLAVGPGDSLSVTVWGSDEARELAVSGIVSTGESEDDSILVGLGWLQAATGEEDRVSAVGVALEAGPEQVIKYAAALEKAAPFPLEARPLTQVYRAQGALLGKLARMMTLLTLVILLLAGMCVMTTLMSIVVERESEIGLMRSLGARDAEVLRMLLGEATLLGILGGLLGLGLGMWNAHWMGQQLFGASITPRAQIVPWVLGITLGLCWLAVLLPLRRALSVEPATALRGD